MVEEKPHEGIQICFELELLCTEEVKGYRPGHVGCGIKGIYMVRWISVETPQTHGCGKGG